MAILNLWINSGEMNLTAESCQTLLQAIATEMEIPVNFPIRSKRRSRNKMCLADLLGSGFLQRR